MAKRMGRAPLPNGQKRQRVTLYVAPATLDALRATGEPEGRVVDRMAQDAAEASVLRDEVARLLHCVFGAGLNLAQSNTERALTYISQGADETQFAHLYHERYIKT